MRDRLNPNLTLTLNAAVVLVVSCTHLEAELVVVLVERDVHQAAAEAVVGKQQEDVLEYLVNVSQVLYSITTNTSLS